MNSADFYLHRNSAPSITITSDSMSRLSEINRNHIENNNNNNNGKLLLDPNRRKKLSIPMLQQFDKNLILEYGTYKHYSTDQILQDDHPMSMSNQNISDQHQQSMSDSNLNDKQNSNNNSNSNLSIINEYNTKYNKNRRKSWHVGKFERRRRKSVLGVVSNTNNSSASTSPTSTIDRKNNKRPSWWNVFVPESWPRSRRASTVGITSTDSARNVNFPYEFRNKSRSVDHGFASPFDLDSLRSKVESRFESVDRLKDGDSSSKENISGKMHKPAEPIKTTTYKVESCDTLTSVAARFDTTPSELAILNRLPSRNVFPGQVIRVPEKRKKKRVSQDGSTGNEDFEGDEDGNESAGGDSEVTLDSEVSSTRRLSVSHDVESTEECELLESLRPASPKPGHVERIRAPLGGSYANRPRHVAPQERFLKIHVRHITDGQGVVAGVLLVTPNAVMFDPNVSDALVIEHGPESYGVIAPMEFVVNSAIYHDIAHMRVAHMQQKHDPNIKQEIYHLKHRDSISAEGGANLYRSENKDKEESETDGTKSDTKGENQTKEPNATISQEDNHYSTRDLVTSTSTPPNTANTCTPPNTTHSSTSEEPQLVMEAEQVIRRLEERRQSSLDHHWAVPKSSISIEEPSLSSQEVIEDKEDTTSTLSTSSHKPSCHDSGIDIRDPTPSGKKSNLDSTAIDDTIILPTPIVKKSNYSDADILLGDTNDFIPPICVIPMTSSSTITSTSVTSASDVSLTSSNESSERNKNSVSFNVEDSKENSNCDNMKEQDKETKKNKMLKRLSYPLAWMEGFSSDKEDKESLPSSGDSSQPASSHSSSVFSKVFSRRPSVSTFIRSQHSHSPQRSVSTSGGTSSSSIAPPKLNYHSMVSVEDMPELFVSFDKLIPRPARSCDDPPLYLRLRMGKPKNKRVPKSTPIMSYGKKKMRPEYWFSVPRNRVDELYKFLMIWVPHLYGDLDEEKVNERGYELVDSDTELWDDDSASPERRGSDDNDDETSAADLGRESWEGLPMCEELRRALYASGSIDFDLFLPDLNGVTEILTEEHRKQLCRHLPARAEGYTWTLVFSTSQHGFSLNSMYRKMTRVESPILLVIQDTDCNVFGALTSCALKVSDHFYGTGESLLFSFTPELQIYNWTGDNMYFIKGNNESLSIGAGDGKFGLWLDGDLYQGRSEPCSTYGNEPLSSQQDFVVKTLECWAFI